VSVSLPEQSVGDAAQELESVLLQLLAAPSPNPPGDVAAAADVVVRYCQAAGLPCVVHRPAAGRRNLVIEVARSDRGRHLVWNGHLDTFPAAGEFPRAYSEEGRVYGRGAVDMKGGVAAFLVAARQLHVQGDLPGSLTLTLVCEEETFGPLGARGLLARAPGLLGDALVSTEPSSLGLVRVAERGFLWVKLRFLGQSLHSAYPSQTEGAILRMAALVRRVHDLVGELNTRLAAVPSSDLATDEAVDKHLGAGAWGITRSVSLNVGTVHGGNAVNLQPSSCEVTLDFRIPKTVEVEDIVALVAAEAERAAATVEVLGRGPANETDGGEAIVTAVVDAVTGHTGARPPLSTGLGCTDARLWRYGGVPACVIGPSPATMGAESEFVQLAELETLVGILKDSARAFLLEGQ
jgi:succinyl-diaminopimelate desuccinylase